LFYLWTASICILALILLLKMWSDSLEKKIYTSKHMPKMMKDYKERCDLSKLVVRRTFVNAFILSSFFIFILFILSMIFVYMGD
jgi:hypothetical protein